MFLTYRRLLIVIGCLLYAGACVAIAASVVSQEDVKWTLWAIAVAHVIFGVEALLLCIRDDSKQVIDQMRAEQAADRRELARLRELVTKLSGDIDTLRKDRATGNDGGKAAHRDMVD